MFRGIACHDPNRCHLGTQDRLQLPGRVEVICEESGASEAAHIHQEIFQQECYWHHGFSLGPGAIVVDVGANIGEVTYASSCCLECLNSCWSAVQSAINLDLLGRWAPLHGLTHLVSTPMLAVLKAALL